MDKVPRHMRQRAAAELRRLGGDGMRCGSDLRRVPLWNSALPRRARSDESVLLSLHELSPGDGRCSGGMGNVCRDGIRSDQRAAFRNRYIARGCARLLRRLAGRR